MKSVCTDIILLSALIFCTACFGGTYSGGSGTAADPYRIATAADWVELVYTPGDQEKQFVLIADIDLAGIVLQPIYNIYFNCVFDGNGHVVRNAVINQPSDNNVGLFRSVMGVIRNLAVENIQITGNNYVGGIVGSSGGTLVSCSVSGTINGNDNVGGLVGSYSGNMTSCHTTGVVNGTENVGGLIGYLSANSEHKDYGNIIDCYSQTTVTGIDRMIGGLVGRNLNGFINRCYATGPVGGTYHIGGLVGYNEQGTLYSCCFKGSASGSFGFIGGLVGTQKKGNITACYATGTVTGPANIGGCIGTNDGNVTACYTTGSVNGDGPGIYGFIGSNIGTVITSFWDINTSGQIGGSVGKGLTTSQMKTLAIFRNAGWGEYEWVMVDGEYPRLSWEQTGYPAIPLLDSVPLAGSGTRDDPFQIRTPTDFALLSWYPAILDKHIQLMNDIDMAGQNLYPIGDLGPFTGEFNGNGHIIHNATIDQPASSFVGIFSYVDSMGRIRNLDLTNVHITGEGQVGSLVAWNSGTVTSCHATGSVAGSGNVVGGLVGYNEGRISYSSASITVTGEAHQVGGLVGTCGTTPLLFSCYSTGSVRGRNDVGGLAGGGGSGSVISCYATGAVTGQEYVGGLLGGGSKYVSSCYSTGMVSGSGSYVGGLIGYNGGSTLSTCFWDTQSSGMNSGVGSGSTGGITGKTTAEMQTLSTFTSAGWDFTDSDGTPIAWTMPENDYPKLYWRFGYSGGNGTTADPYRISIVADWQELMAAGYDWDKCFILTTDIDLAGVSMTTVAPDTDSATYGFQGVAFSGILDGTGHFLRNGIITTPSQNYVGLFGHVGSMGQILNLGIENFQITGKDYVGGLAGWNEGSIAYCRAAGAVNGTNSYTGGLVGRMDQGSIRSCYTLGSVTGKTIAGGLVGVNQQSVVDSSYSAASVSGTEGVGGLVGSFWEGVVRASFWDLDATGQLGSANGKGLSTEQMKTLSIFRDAGWGAKGWVMNDGVDRPRLNWEDTGYSAIPDAIPLSFSGNGTEANPYQIWTPADYALLSWRPDVLNASFVLMADIDLSSQTLYPIGDLGPFTGTFDGQNHKIDNATIVKLDQGFTGLFGYVDSGGQIGNLDVRNLEVQGGGIAGGLAAYLGSSGRIDSCRISGTVKGRQYVGGLVGWNYQGSVNRSSFSGSVYGNAVIGGLEGWQNGGTTTASFAAGYVEGNRYIGGLIGGNRSGDISDCYATNFVKGTSSYFGGLVGENGEGGKIQSCYSTGLISGFGSSVGGLIGGSWNAQTLASFWDRQTSGRSASAGGMGKTMAEMKTLATFTGVGWDFVGESANGTADMWRLCADGTGYPRLAWEFSGNGDFACPDGIALEDLSYLAERWLANTPAGVGATDGNGDSVIDLMDFAILAEHWLETYSVSSLVGHWSFDGHFNPLAGVYWGEPIDDPGFVGPEQTKVGSGAVDLDGNDSVVMNGFLGITGTKARTCMAWIKTTSTVGPIVYWGDKNTTGGLWDLRVNSSGQLRAQMNGCGVSGVTAVNTGQWVHVAAVLPEGGDNASQVLLYVNGKMETNGVVTVGAINTKALAAMRIGANETGQYFTGLIDDVRVYDRALTAEEIAAVMGQ